MYNLIELIKKCNKSNQDELKNFINDYLINNSLKTNFDRTILRENDLEQVKLFAYDACKEIFGTVWNLTSIDNFKIEKLSLVKL